MLEARSLRGLAAAALLIAAPAGLAAEDPTEDKPMRLEGTARWGSVRRIREPVYPDQLLASKAKVYVDMSGHITPFGVLEGVEFVADSDEARLMVEPMKEVIRDWEFQVPVDNDCQPYPVIVQNRVRFEFGARKAKLSVARGQRGKAADRELIDSFKILDRFEPVYPRGMRQRGWEAHVYSKVIINPHGDVLEVAATVYSRQSRSGLAAFEESAVDAIKQWKFAPAPTGMTRDRKGCYSFVFRPDS